jgi:hypothetical protein
MTATVFWNYCRFQSSTSGTAAFTVGSAAPSDVAGSHDVPENCSVISGNTYRYYARNAAGTQAEWGRGTYSTSTHTLTRTTIDVNSDGTTSPVNFISAPLVDVFPNPQKSVESPTFPSGTRMLFQQTNAPLGWTKDTNYNDFAPRIVNGTVSQGGVNGFSSTFSYRTDDPVTLSVGQIPSHQHTDTYDTIINGPGSLVTVDSGSTWGLNLATTNTGAQGGSGSHAHTYDMRVLYLDFIIGVKV